MRPDRNTGFKLVLTLLAVMWVSEVVDIASGNKLDELGIEPRETDGLIGVGTAPFLHAGFGHLLSNTLPFVILGLAIALEGIKRLAAVAVLFLGGALLGGLVPRAGVSWQGHFFGAAGGVLAAWALANRPARRAA